jgi:hypothetical protein
MTITNSEIDTVECAYGECPLHDENPPFNSVTLAAMQEAKDIANGIIPGKWNKPCSISEMREILDI